jgi:hypothetical protein
VGHQQGIETALVSATPSNNSVGGADFLQVGASSGPVGLEPMSWISSRAWSRWAGSAAVGHQQGIETALVSATPSNNSVGGADFLQVGASSGPVGLEPMSWISSRWRRCNRSIGRNVLHRGGYKQKLMPITIGRYSRSG